MIAKDVLKSAREGVSFPSVRQAVPAASVALADERLAHLVRDTRRALARALQIALVEHGVAFGHWTFLRILWIRDDINQRRLSDLAGVMEPTTFAALQGMERLGYIERRHRPGNRKNIYVYLTHEGRALHDKLEPAAIAINARAIAGVPEGDIIATRRTLLAIMNNLAIEETGPTPAPRPAAIFRIDNQTARSR